MKLAVVICGRIGSGKSTSVDFVAAEFGFKVVSFGRYIGHVAERCGTAGTRDELQDLGDHLFRSRGSSGLLKDALKHFEIGGHDSVVFDGVRHPEILADIRQAAAATIAVYLEVNHEERFRRHQARQAYSCSLEEFLIVDGHTVEAGIAMITDHCDLVVNAVCSVATVQDVLREHIIRHTEDQIFNSA